jgi:signal transduction histidine kinase
MTKELATNAARHASATAVLFDLEVVRSQVILTVADNGRGFDVEARRSSGNGLTNLAHRIEALRGTMEVRSSAAGTSVRISIPRRHTD